MESRSTTLRKQPLPSVRTEAAREPGAKRFVGGTQANEIVRRIGLKPIKGRTGPRLAY